MPNILLIAPFHEPSGYGIAARHLAKTLILIDENLVCRNQNLGRDDNYQDKEFINKLCEKPIDNPDIVIQYTLPKFMEYFPNA